MGKATQNEMNRRGRVLKLRRYERAAAQHMLWRALLACALALTIVAGAAAGSHAAYGISSFDGSVTADQSGDVSYSQAGGHPYAVSTTFAIDTKNDPANGDPWPEEPIKDVLVDVPPGLVGNPTSVAQCPLEQLNARSCSSATQVGTATVTFVVICFSGVCIPGADTVPVYSVVTPPGVPARFAFIIAGAVVTLDAAVRTGGDYGLSVNVKNVSTALPVISTTLTLWGVPADPAHTPERSCSDGTVGCAAGVTPKAFLTMPTSCSGPQMTSVRSDSWFHPGTFASASFVSHRTVAEGGAPIGVTGCDQVPFDPTLKAAPVKAASPGPSGWTFDLTMPQDSITDPNAIAQGALKKAVVTLPAGVRVSPSSADGLGACSPSQIALKSSVDPTCPDASKVGSLTIDTPLLDEQLMGSVYLATPNDNPSHSLVALYLVAKGAGLIVKLPGSVTLNPTTGQISATFDNIPQLPFSRLHLEFFGGSRAALSNPPRCGTYTTKSVMTSWGGKTVITNDSFTTSHDGNGEVCPSPRFDPNFSAGTSTPDGQAPVGGSFSSFSFRLSRSDDDEELAAINSVDMPNGLLARAASVPLCDAGKMAAGTCGEMSRIGEVRAAAGPGLNPFQVSGRVYLGGRYRGAPFSLSIVVPAVAGPFDLGTIVVRAAVGVDPRTATLTVVTDPLPTILQGIPLQVRRIRVLIDRSKFFVNPTSCNPKRIGATAVSTAGTTASLSARFKVRDCESLPLSPKMRITVGAKGRTRKGVSTPLTTTLTQPPGQAGLKAVGVTLPLTLNARLDVVNNACTQAQFDSGHCAKARAGSAVAVTPLLKQPLRGGAFFVTDPHKPAGSLPNLVIALRGQVAFNLVGTIEIPHGQLLATHFNSVPDVPIRSFSLRLVAGRHGPLGTAANLCTARSRRQLATLSFRGHNGKLVQVSQPLAVRGCRHKRARR